jgi:ElaB/YqjD/DUF883 family membrane-anchored ribosome-binding protein
MPSESPELIEQRLRESRRNLTAKVADLGREVSDSVHETTATVRSTMNSLQSGVTDTFATLNDGVNDTIRSVVGTTTDAIDVRPQIRANPLACVGASLAAGLVAGLLVTRRSGPHSMGSHESFATAPNSFGGTSPPSWIDGLLDQVASEVKRVAGDVLTLAADQAKQTVSAGVPNLVNGLLSRVSAGPERRI